MEMCNKREKCIAKTVCAINIREDGYNCKQFHKALESKLQSATLVQQFKAEVIKYYQELNCVTHIDSVFISDVMERLKQLSAI